MSGQGKRIQGGSDVLKYQFGCTDPKKIYVNFLKKQKKKRKKKKKEKNQKKEKEKRIKRKQKKYFPKKFST